jgi:DNA repair protein SbcC/Rad50
MQTPETELETLSGLQQEGKLIGMISHVSALKDRISTQINITHVSGVVAHNQVQAALSC